MSSRHFRSRLARAGLGTFLFNPVRPLPPVGGLPRLHGIEPQVDDVSCRLATASVTPWSGHHARGARRAWPSCSSPGHPAQGRHGEHEVVIVFDPKGDADLLSA